MAETLVVREHEDRIRALEQLFDQLVRFALPGYDPRAGLAPDTPDYVVGTSDPAIPNARVPTNTSSITFDLTTPNQVKANVASDGVTNAMLANMATVRLKGRVTAGTGDPEDITGTQSTGLLDVFVGDSGAGGTKGLVPAPGAGDGAAEAVLHADGTWAVIPPVDLSTVAVVPFEEDLSGQADGVNLTFVLSNAALPDQFSIFADGALAEIASTNALDPDGSFDEVTLSVAPTAVVWAKGFLEVT